MESIAKTRHWDVAVDSAEKLVRVTRSMVPLGGLDDLQRAHKELLRLIAPYLEYRLLLDVRFGPSRSDPEYEQGLQSLRKQILARFDRVAILVKSAVGKLHATRLTREDGSRAQIFQDEAMALDYLRAGD